MISQPVIPRVPLALQASGGVTIDPTTGVVSVNASTLAGITPQLAAQILATLAAAAPPGGGSPPPITGFPTSDPHIAGAIWNNGTLLSISQG